MDFHKIVIFTDLLKCFYNLNVAFYRNLFKTKKNPLICSRMKVFTSPSCGFRYRTITYMKSLDCMLLYLIIIIIIIIFVCNNILFYFVKFTSMKNLLINKFPGNFIHFSNVNLISVIYTAMKSTSIKGAWSRF